MSVPVDNDNKDNNSSANDNDNNGGDNVCTSCINEMSNN